MSPAGQRLTAAQRLQMFRSGEMRVESYQRDQESIRVYGTMAIVIYRSAVPAARNGTDVSTQQRVTTVLLKRDGRWRAVLQQSSPILRSASAATIHSVHHQFQPAPTVPDDREVQQVEQRIADATGKDDADALESLWSPEYVWVGPNGGVLSRAQRLAIIRAGQIKSEGYTMDQQDIRMYGATAVVTFRSTVAAAIDGKDI